MLKKTLLTIVFGIAAVNLIIDGYNFVWPLIDSSGVIETGKYREIKIGDSKRDVISKATVSIYHSKLRMVAYQCPDGRSSLIFDVDPPCQLQKSDIWILSYTSIHKETVTLYFQDDQVVKISYHRDMFAP